MSLKFPTQATPWPTNGLRRASVNSFGFGGSNAHAVLEDAYHYLKLHGLSGKHCTSGHSRPVVNRHAGDLNASQVRGAPESQLNTSSLLPSACPALLVFSTFDEPGLDRLALGYQKYFSQKRLVRSDDDLLQRLAFTLAQKRSWLPWKSFTVFSSIPDPETDVRSLLSSPTRSLNNFNVGFVFTGQGAHWSAMGRELVKYSIFKESLESANKYFRTVGCQPDFTGKSARLRLLSFLTHFR